MKKIALISLFSLSLMAIAATADAAAPLPDNEPKAFVPSPESELGQLERLTDRVLAQPDYPSFSYAVGDWKPLAETLLATVSPDSLELWEPEGMTRIDTPEGAAWAAIWLYKGQGHLLWYGWRRPTKNAEGLTLAFHDTFATTDTLLSISSYALKGPKSPALLTVEGAESGDKYFQIADIDSRMCLRTLSDINFSAEQKEFAEKRLRARMKRWPEILASNLATMPELVVCDAPRDVIRTVTYLVAFKDFTTHCGGWLVRPQGRGEKPKVTELFDGTAKINNPEKALLSPKVWYGAVYTNIIPFEFDGTDYFALVGFKGADLTEKKRVIDILAVDGNRVVFGADLFVHPRDTYKRRIFTYSARVGMQIAYDKKAEMIVFDHLAPSEAIMTGQYAFYGPDLTYDAYQLTDRGWLFQSDIQITEEDGAIPNEIEEMPAEELEYEYEEFEDNTSSAGRSSSKRKSSTSGKAKSGKSGSAKSSSGKSASAKANSRDGSSRDGSSHDDSEDDDSDPDADSGKFGSKSSSKSDSKAKAKKSSKGSSKSSASARDSKDRRSSSVSRRSSNSDRRDSDRGENRVRRRNSWFDKGRGNSAPNIRNRNSRR